MRLFDSIRVLKLRRKMSGEFEIEVIWLFEMSNDNNPAIDWPAKRNVSSSEVIAFDAMLSEVITEGNDPAQGNNVSCIAEQSTSN